MPIDFVERLLRKTSLRKGTSALSLQQIAKIIEDLQDIYKERDLQEKAKSAELEAKETAIKEIQRQLAELGISPEDLEQNQSSRRGPKVEPKYRLIDVNGEPHEWSGRGRMPKVFQERIEKGATKEDFLIQS